MAILEHLICLLQSLWGMVATVEHQSVSHGGVVIFTIPMLTAIETTRETLDPPRDVFRSVGSGWPGPATFMDDISIFNQIDFRQMTARMEAIHNNMHGFVNMGLPHIAFRDPFVFLLHSNVDRLFALWQNDPEYPDRLDPAFVYGSFSNFPTLNEPIPPWSGVNPGEPLVRPWAAPENLARQKDL